MDNEDFKRLGAELLGYGWQTRLAKALGIDASTVRRWVSGALPVQPGAVAYLDMHAQRQSARGQYIAARQMQSGITPIYQKPARQTLKDEINEIPYFRNKIPFSGVTDPKPFPSIHVESDQSGNMTVRMSDEPNDNIDMAKYDASFILTRHPDPAHLSAYVEEVEKSGFQPIITQRKSHFYTLITYSIEDHEQCFIRYQISTHSGQIRTTDIKATTGTIGDQTLEEMAKPPLLMPVATS